MLALRQRKKVIERKITIEIPENFGNEVEIIILSDIDEKNVEFWSKEEIEKMGTIASVSYSLDDEDFSKW